MVPPVVLDIDGTLTRADADTSPAPIDPRIFDRLYTWDAPVILATGKAFPAPVALCQFIGIPIRVIAETGAIACTDERLVHLTGTEAPQAVLTTMRERGHEPGDRLGLINRWRETEVAFTRDTPLEILEEVANQHDLDVVDTGYAYHVKDPAVSKGRGLERLLAWEDLAAEACVAIGDSANDVSLFERVGSAYAVANAHVSAREAADEVVAERHADGTLSILDRLAA